MPPEDSRNLVLRASSGDHNAMEGLLERHLPGLRTYVSRNIGAAVLARESSADVVQSVCREVLQHMDRFEYHGEAAFRQWLYQAALRKIIDRHRYYQAEKRNQAREAKPGVATTDPMAQLAMSLGTPSKDAEMREEVARLERAFERLAETDRQAIRMIYIQGCSHAQVAETLGCTEVASRKLLSRALARLSRLIVQG